MDTVGGRMIYRSIAIVLMFLICNLSAHATTECNTKLTNQDRYEDLNKTLQCLSSRIQKLEQQITIQNNNIVKSVSVENTNVATDYFPLPTYKDENFLVTLKSCTKKGKNISCVLEYKNITDTNVEVVISRSTKVVDANGERWDYENDTAIGWQGFTEIIQNTHLTTKFTFEAQGNTTGTKFSLFIIHRLRNVEGFKITLNDVFIN
ncbi:MAG: hypothetical protein L3J75_15315 [Methylococcaceae bacterium]|nr:hypothetical protein [Methylococcaceae bacterium]